MVGVTNLEFPINTGEKLNLTSGGIPPALEVFTSDQFVWPSPTIVQPAGGKVPLEKSSEKIEFTSSVGGHFSW